MYTMQQVHNYMLLYGRETLYLTIKIGHKLRVFEKKFADKNT
jgi:hypothetical protein